MRISDLHALPHLTAFSAEMQGHQAGVPAMCSVHCHFLAGAAAEVIEEVCSLAVLLLQPALPLLKPLSFCCRPGHHQGMSGPLSGLCRPC